MVRREGDQFQCHLYDQLTFTTNVLCDWDFSGCGSVRQGCIEVSPIVYNSNSVTIRIGAEYDADDLWVVLKPVDKTQALETEYVDIMFDLDTISVEIVDDLAATSEIVKTVNGFTWEMWIQHPGYVPSFCTISGEYVVDNNGDIITCYDKIADESFDVKRSHEVLPSTRAHYTYNFDNN